MRCRECDYPLWNLRDKHCPECGKEFRVSEYEFVANSMRFGCPHCDQCYFGTGETGHLVPMEFDCVKCGQHIHMDDMTVAPAAGVKEAETIVDCMPWLERKKTGFIKGWFLTIGRSLFNPARLGKTIPQESSLLSAFWFYAFTHIIYLSTVALTFVLFFMITMAFARNSGGGMGGGMMLPMLGSFIIGPIIYLTLLSIICLLWYLSAITVLRLTGKVIYKSSRRVFQVMCYSSGANILIAMPCLGMYLTAISWIWWAISAIFMLHEITRYSYKRITSSFLLFPLLFVGGIIVLFVGILGTVSRQIGTVNNMPFEYYMQQNDTNKIVTGLFDYSRANAGTLPVHAVQLVTGDFISESDLCAVELYTTNYIADPVPVAGRTLDQITDFDLDEDQRNVYVQFAIDALPDNVIAHRLGDYIFTYHGIDIRNPPDPDLWLVVMYPDANHANKKMYTGYIVGTVNNGSEYIDIADFNTQLAEQNQIRINCGLAPLPDLATVTSDSPASASSTEVNSTGSDQ